MTTISKSGISTNATIQADHDTRVIDALDGTSGDDLIISGSLTVSSSLIQSGSHYLPPQTELTVEGGEFYNLTDNSDFLVRLNWTGTGNATVNLFSCTGSNTNRSIRFIASGPGLGGSDKITLEGHGSETIDGSDFTELSRDYEGIMLWSDGTEWFVIQKKG